MRALSLSLSASSPFPRSDRPLSTNPARADCQDFVLPGLGVSGIALETQTDYNCQSGFCSSSGYCANKVTTVGGDCSFDMTRGCGAGLRPVSNGATCTCQPGPSQNARARARRSEVQRRGTCPASHTACTVDGVKGFECIDVAVSSRPPLLCFASAVRSLWQSN